MTNNIDYELNYPVYVSNEKFKNCIDLLLIANENKSHYVYIQDFNNHTMSILKVLTNLCAIKQKTKTRNIFAAAVYNVLVVKKSDRTQRKLLHNKW